MNHPSQGDENGLGLMEYNARFYDPNLNRFLSPDTIIPNPYNPVDIDRYSYARNNPVRYKDPSGHIPVCDVKVKCADQWRQDKAYDKLGEVGFMKYEIKYEFGIGVADGTMNWSINNLNNAYNTLNMINDTLNGNLKSMVGGTTFTTSEKIINPNDEYCKDPNRCLYSGAAGATGVTFYLRNNSVQIPFVNFLHETGHLLNMVPATANVFTGQIPENPTWVDDDGYVDIDIVGPRLGNQPIQARPMGEAGYPGEYWADAFANFVGMNIDLSTSAGEDIYRFVSDTLAPYRSP